MHKRCCSYNVKSTDGTDGKVIPSVTDLSLDGEGKNVVVTYSDGHTQYLELPEYQGGGVDTEKIIEQANKYTDEKTSSDQLINTLSASFGSGFELDKETNKINVIKVYNEVPDNLETDKLLVVKIDGEEYLIPALKAVEKPVIRPYYYRDLTEAQKQAMYDRYKPVGFTRQQYDDSLRSAALSIDNLNFLDSQGLIPTLDEALKSEGKTDTRPSKYKELTSPQLEYALRVNNESFYFAKDWDYVRNIFNLNDGDVPEEVLNGLEQKKSIPAKA